MTNRPFLNAQPTPEDVRILSEYIGTYRDGSGNFRESDGSSRADPRQIERCIAELVNGETTENKSYYDFVVLDNHSGKIFASGGSVKSKQVDGLEKYDPKTWKLTAKAKDAIEKSFENRNAKRAKNGQPALAVEYPPNFARAYLELSNSAAKNRDDYLAAGLTDDQLNLHLRPEEFGEVLLQRQIKEKKASEESIKKSSGHKNMVFAQDACVFISVIYTKPNKFKERQWIVSSFSADLPKPHIWSFKGKALVGYDVDGLVLYEWYYGSGSQFKYYPKLSTRIYGTKLFFAPKPAVESLPAKADRLFRERNQESNN